MVSQAMQRSHEAGSAVVPQIGNRVGYPQGDGGLGAVEVDAESVGLDEERHVDGSCTRRTRS